MIKLSFCNEQKSLICLIFTQLKDETFYFKLKKTVKISFLLKLSEKRQIRAFINLSIS